MKYIFTTLSTLYIILCLSSLSMAKTLYFPHIASDTSWETEICLINASNIHNLSGSLTTYNDSGLQLDTTSIMLAPDAREEIIVGDELANPSQIGYILFESDSNAVIGYTKFYINSTYRVAVPATAQINDSDIVIPHIASDTKWWTGVSLLNTTDATKELTIEFSNGTTKNRTIAPKEHQVFTVKQLFNNLSQPSINSAVIKNGKGLVGLELFGSNGGLNKNSLSGVLLKVDTTGSIYYPHIASDSTWWTGVVAYNPTPSACDLAITPYQEDGTMLTPQALQIAGNQKYVGSASSLNLPEASAWLKIDASQPITGFELFGAWSGNQLAGYTAVGISGSNGIFPKLEKAGWTGIAFVNVGAGNANVTLTAYSNSGNALASENIELSGNQKIVSNATSLFSADISTATYLKYSSTSDIVGFQMNGSGDGTMLDALPADNSGITVNELLASTTIDGQGGTLAAGGFSLNIPAGTFNSAVELKLYKTGTHASFAQGVISDSFRVTGLPDSFPETLLPDLQTTGTLSGESFIVVGEEIDVSSQTTPVMAYHLFPADPNLGMLTIPKRATTKNQLFAEDAPLRNNSSDTPISLDFFGITGWATYNANEGLRTNGSQSHFKIRYPTYWVSRTDIDPLFQYLEEAYDTYLDMGFSYGARTNWPLEVTVANMASDTYGLFCSSFFGINSTTMKFNQNKLGNLASLRLTAGHEFFHFVQYLYDSRINVVKTNKHFPFTVSLHWLNEAAAVWAEEKFTSTPNYVSPIRAGHEIAPCNGLEAGTNGDIVQAANHGYGNSAFIKYLAGRYGDSIVRDIYLKILDQQHPIQAIDLALSPNHLFMVWEPFLREYLSGNIYNVAGSRFTGYKSGLFRIQSEADKNKSFTQIYPDLSAKFFMIRLDDPDISPAKAITFKIDQIVCDLTLFKVKKSDTSIHYVSHSSTQILTQKDLRSFSDDGYYLLIMVSNSNYSNSPKLYTNTKTIKLDILVESIAAAITVSTSKDKLDADGTSTSIITATVTDATGNPVAGETVTFSATTGSLSADKVDTDVNGTASVIYTAPGSAPPSGAATITVSTSNAITETPVIALNQTQPSSWPGWPEPQWCPKTGSFQEITNLNGNPDKVFCNYNDNGSLFREWPLLGNFSNGFEKQYYDNGQLQFEKPWKNDKLNGLVKLYSREGQLAYARPYVDDLKNGIEVNYYESGKLQAEIPWQNNMLNGTKKEYYENGQLLYETPYINDMKHGLENQYYESGQLEFARPWQNDQENGTVIWYYESGQIHSETPYLNGIINGLNKSYYENGQLKNETPYVNGQRSGMAKEYYENGQLSKETPYAGDQRHGMAKDYYASGQLHFETPYIDNLINGTRKEYYEGGSIKYETPYVEDLKNGIEVLFYENGARKGETPWVDGAKHGHDKKYDEDGKVTSCDIYDAGIKVGSCMP